MDDGIPTQDKNGQQSAAELIRAKLAAIYSEEPKADEEIAEIGTSGVHSRHQQFLSDLKASGKSVAQIQTEWHDYYQKLSDEEKHLVWREFYENEHKKKPNPPVSHEIDSRNIIRPLPQTIEDRRTEQEIKQKLIDTISANGKLKTRHMLKRWFFQ